MDAHEREGIAAGRYLAELAAGWPPVAGDEVLAPLPFLETPVRCLVLRAAGSCFEVAVPLDAGGFEMVVTLEELRRARSKPSLSRDARAIPESVVNVDGQKVGGRNSPGFRLLPRYGLQMAQALRLALTATQKWWRNATAARSNGSRDIRAADGGDPGPMEPRGSRKACRGGCGQACGNPGCASAARGAEGGRDMSSVPPACIHTVQGEPHVFFVDEGTGHLRHGPVRTVQGGIAFVAITPHEVVGVQLEQLVPVPKFFGGSDARG